MKDMNEEVIWVTGYFVVLKFNGPTDDHRIELLLSGNDNKEICTPLNEYIYWRLNWFDVAEHNEATIWENTNIKSI